MGAIGRGTFSALVAPDLHKVVIEIGKERPLEYPSVLNTGDMPWNPIKDQQISGLGSLAPKPEGSQFTRDQPIIGGQISYTAVPYGLAAEITYEMWQDELYGVMRELAAEMGRAARNRKEVDAWRPFNSAFVNTTFAGFDGVALCSTAHTRLDGGANMANRPSPDVGLSITGIQNMMINFHNMVDERGLPRLMSPTNIVIGSSNVYVAREILGSTNKPYTTNNEINALVQDDLSYTVCHYLTTATNWFGTAAKGIHDVWFYLRTDTIPDAFDDPWTKNAVYSVYQRHIPGFGSWRGIYGSNA